MFGFGQAIEYLKVGKCLAREGWNGKGMFVYKQPVAKIERSFIPDLTSMPISAKSILIDKGIKSVTYTNQMVIVNSERIDNWVPSVSDIFAEDWVVVE